MLKTVLVAVCSFTVAATAYLSLSLAILRPPRANYPEWVMMAALFVAQSVFTLVAAAGVVSGGWIRWLVLAGGVAIIWVGASWAHDTLTSEHFEGYALVLGSMLVVQGALTIAVFLRLQDFRIAGMQNWSKD
jgi:hypothetical protein